MDDGNKYQYGALSSMTSTVPRMSNPMKLGLGTVQFGLDYGISNQNGITTEEEVGKILEIADCQKIRVIDTAAQYGNSEEVLGRTLPQKHKFKIVTKTHRVGADKITDLQMDCVEKTFYQSINHLRTSSVYALLVHHADDLLADNGEKIMQKLMEFKQRGLIEKAGVSIYTGDQIEKVLDKYPIDIIQLPINVLDQRLIKGGYLKRLKEAGVEIHARSVFLQGILIMNPEQLPAHFDSIKPHLVRYQNMIRERGLQPVQAAFGFVAGLPEIDHVICGVNNHLQLKELCAIHSVQNYEDYKDYSVKDESILNPSLWRGIHT